MTYEQFLADPTIEPHSEWVDGEVIPMPPVHEAQNDEDIFLGAILKVYVDIKELGAIYREPFQMKAAADLPGRAPDIFFVKQRNRKRVHGTRLVGPADLVIEIVSPESQTRDRVHKFSEYERGGVPEYWLVDPDKQSAEFYLRGRNGKFKPATVVNGVYHCKAVQGFWLKVQWLWQQPSTGYVLKQLGVI
jgi:Uma2 family endonuclease